MRGGDFSVGYSCLILHCQSVDKISFLAHPWLWSYIMWMTELFFLFSMSEYLIFSCRRQLHSWTEVVLSMLTFLFFLSVYPYSQKRECFPSSKCYGITDTCICLFFRILLSVIQRLAFIRPRKTEQSHQVHLGLSFMVSYLHITLSTCSMFFFFLSQGSI